MQQYAGSVSLCLRRGVPQQFVQASVIQSLAGPAYMHYTHGSSQVNHKRAFERAESVHQSQLRRSEPSHPCCRSSGHPSPVSETEGLTVLS